MMMNTTQQTTAGLKIGQASADGRGGGGGGYSPRQGSPRKNRSRQEFAGRFPNWCTLVGLIEFSEKVADLWGSTLGSFAEETRPAAVETPAPRPAAAAAGNGTSLMIGFYHATAPAMAAAAPAGRAHPLDLLGARRY